MKKDFSYNIYYQLIYSIKSCDYAFLPFVESILNHNYIKKYAILKHDIDKLPNNALQMAELENKLGIQASYYFRIGKKSYNEDIIRQISKLGHEVGYHYENLSEISRERRAKSKEELFELSVKDFELNLEKMRQFYPVKTICPHGSPLSKYDNKTMWEKYDYRDYGIIADPSFDVDYNEIFYITDTGRSWNNSNASIRDKVKSKFDIKIKDTYHLIEKIQNNELPDKIMINVHPQRWNDHGFRWYKELIGQNIKNVAKRIFIRFSDSEARRHEE